MRHNFVILLKTYFTYGYLLFDNNKTFITDNNTFFKHSFYLKQINLNNKRRSGQWNGDKLVK